MEEIIFICTTVADGVTFYNIKFKIQGHPENRFVLSQTFEVITGNPTPEQKRHAITLIQNFEIRSCTVAEANMFSTRG